MKNRVLVTRKLPNFEATTKGLQVEFVLKDKIKPKELLEEVTEYDGIICTLADPICEDVIVNATGLKVVANFAVGYNNIDLNLCNQRNIYVTNTPDVLTSATADLALSLMLAAARNLKPGLLETMNGEWKGWEPMGHLGQELLGKTLGIVGLGRIGFEFAKRASRAWNMKVIYHNRSPNKEAEVKLAAQKVSLEELASESDFISLHCPLTEDTKEIINKNIFELMKPHCVIVNTARGEVVQQDDLFEALKNKKIFAAGLDVTTPEPLPSDHKLYTLDNAFILPHIGSATFFARNQMTEICVNNVRAVLEGKTPPQWVNRGFNN